MALGERLPPGTEHAQLLDFAEGDAHAVRQVGGLSGAARQSAIRGSSGNFTRRASLPWLRHPLVKSRTSAGICRNLNRILCFHDARGFSEIGFVRRIFADFAHPTHLIPVLLYAVWIDHFRPLETINPTMDLEKGCFEPCPVPDPLEPRESGCQIASRRRIIDHAVPRSSAADLQGCSGGRSGDLQWEHRTLYLIYLLYSFYLSCQVVQPANLT